MRKSRATVNNSGNLYHVVKLASIISLVDTGVKTLLSERLRELREEKGWSLAEIGKKLGVPRTTYSNYELGKRQPPNDMIPQFADIFGVSSDYLLGLTDDPLPIAGQDGWQNIEDAVGDAELAKEFHMLGATIIKLNAELLQRGFTKKELEKLLTALRDLKR